MIHKQASRVFASVLLVLFLYSPALSSQLKLLCKFSGVNLPYALKYQNMILEKGKYDLEAVKKPTSTDYFLRIKKGGKVLELIQGEQWDYETRGMALMGDPDIPDKCTMKMRKNSEEKVFTIIVETGKKNRAAPFARLRFKFEYEE